MQTAEVRQGSQHLRLVGKSPLDQEINAFLIDRKARGMTEGTVTFYRKKLTTLRAYLETVGVDRMEGITPTILRSFLLGLKDTHTPGGIHALYRATKTFLLWWEAETEPEGWKNPISRVPAPKVPTDPLEPVPLSDVKAMVAASKGRKLLATRDRALLLFLVDSGVRVSELLALNVGDVNLATGSILVRCGKGRKPRTVFVGNKTRRELVAYMRHRKEAGDDAPLWVTDEGDRLTYSGVRHLLRRRAEDAGVAVPSAHSFRRAFAICSLRAGVDLVSLQRLLGHSDLSTVNRYLRQLDADLQAAHEKAGPVDRLL